MIVSGNIMNNFNLRINNERIEKVEKYNCLGTLWMEKKMTQRKSQELRRR